MPHPADIIRPILSAADFVSPHLAAMVAEPAFRTPRPTRRVHKRERDVHRQAKRDTIRVDGERVVFFEWHAAQTGAPAVLLVHGWQGRAAQFAEIARDLRDSGYTVVGFDAQGNGDSSGWRSDPARYVRAMQALQKEYGEFHGVVAHSIGALASMQAIREGLRADRFVSIAGVSDFNWSVDAFATRVGLSEEARQSLRLRMRRRRLRGVDDTPAYFATLDGVRCPLPPRVRTTFIHGGADSLVPSEHAVLMHAAHDIRDGGSRLHLIPSVGHTKVLSAPETLAAVRSALGTP